MGTCFSCEYYKFGYCNNRLSLYYKKEVERDDRCAEYDMYILENENEPLERGDFF